jgi:hypothetical protein
MIEGWTKVCKHVSVYDYYGHFYIFTPWPLAQGICRDIPYLRRIGVTGFVSETQQNWANQGLNFYLAAKLLWDTDRDCEAMLSEFYERFYGPAARPMRAYWDAWEAAMDRQPCGGYAWVAMLTPELLKQTGELLDEAERLAAGNEKVQSRLAFHRIGYRYTQAYARMRWHGDAGELEQAVRAGEEAVRIVEETRGMRPEPFSTQLASDQTGIQMLKYKRKWEASTKPAAANRPPRPGEPKAIFGAEEK